MSRAVYILICVILAIGGIIFFSYQLISSGSFPSLNQYIASSTLQLSTTTNELASSSISQVLESIMATSSTSTSTIATSTTSETTSSMKVISIKTLGGTIKAYVADNQTTQEKGLGDRDSLPLDKGMLFVFPDSEIYQFWMKDMHFSLDMIWIDENHKVADVSADISPDTFPNSFQPSSPVRYVLEVNAGIAKKNQIKTGTTLNFNL